MDDEIFAIFDKLLECEYITSPNTKKLSSFKVLYSTFSLNGRPKIDRPLFKCDSLGFTPPSFVSFNEN